MDDISSPAKELRDIKMLLILQLLSAEVKQKQIALALGIREATMSRLLAKTSNKIAKSKSDEGND